MAARARFLLVLLVVPAEGLIIAPRAPLVSPVPFEPYYSSSMLLANWVPIPLVTGVVDGVDECRRACRDEFRKGAHAIKIMVRSRSP